MVNYLVYTHGKTAVLHVVGLGLMSKTGTGGADWFTSLCTAEQIALTSSISAWTRAIKDRFQRDPTALIAETDSLSHTFANEKKLSLY